METVKSTPTPQTPAATAGTGWKTFAAGGALAGLLAANGFLLYRSSNLETEVSRLQANTRAEITGLKEATNVQAVTTRRAVEQINSQIEQSQTTAQKYAAQQARSNADKAAARVSRKTEEMMNGFAAEQKAQQAVVSEQLGAVKQASEENQTKVGEVATEVVNVKSEVAKAKTDLENTVADLRSVRGDLGVQSGLIATNSTELAALRSLGERNYFEFNIAKTSGQVKLGGVSLTLKKADVKRNKFNLELLADDKRVEKKDKTVNEPVQFYVSGARQPYEIVVNEVSKDRIVGYLASPKVMSARR